MGKFKIGLQLDVKFLEELCKEKTSGVSIQKCKHHLVMHPIHLKNLNGSIKDLLNIGIGKFDKKLGGLLLGYQNIKLINKKGIIHNDSSGIHVDLEGDFFVFKPTIGREMQGVVNRKGKDFVGVLVYNTFNVSIPKPQNEDKWLGQDVQIGNEILFQLQHVDMSLHLPYIRGELLSIISKSNEVETQSKPIKKGKSSKILFEDIEKSDHQHELVQLPNEDTEHLTEELKIKKKKKKIKEKDETNIHEENTKKSKKRKMSESLTDGEQKLSLNDSYSKKAKKSKYSEVPV